MAVKPSPLFPSSSWSSQVKNRSAGPLKKQGGDRILSPAQLLASDSWLVGVECWPEQSLVGGGGLFCPSIHIQDPKSPQLRGRG